MNINSVDKMLLEKMSARKMQLKNEPVSTPDVPVSKPSNNTMNALDIHAKNNIAFQGVKLPKGIQNHISKLNGNHLKSLIVGGAMALGVMSMTSCDDELLVPSSGINIEVNVENDNSAVTALIELLSKWIEQNSNNDAEIIKQLMLLNSNLTTLSEQLANNQITQEEFQKQVLENQRQIIAILMTNQENQDVIIDILVQNGKTEAESKELLEKIFAELEAGNISRDEALDLIMSELGDVNATLRAILAKVSATNDSIGVVIDMMKENQIIDATQHEEMMGKFDALHADVKAGNISADEYYQKSYQYMFLDQAAKTAIINQLIANGMSQAQANALLKELNEKVENGQIKAEDAVKNILAELNKTNELLGEILENVVSIGNDLSSLKDSYEQGKEEGLKLLSAIYNENQDQTKLLETLNKETVKNGERLDKIIETTDELFVLASDPDKFSSLIEAYKNAKDQDRDALKALFNQLGLDITAVVEKSAQNQVEAMDEVVEAIVNFQADYVTNEATQTALLTNIADKMSVIIKFQGVNHEELKSAIANVQNAVDVNTKDVTEQLSQLNDTSKEILAKIDAMYAKVGETADMAGKYYDLFSKKWDNTLSELNKLAELFDVNNGKLDKIGEGIDKTNDALKLANNYLYTLNVKADAIREALNGGITAGGEGMTMDEFKEFMLQRDEANYNKFVEFVADLGLDKIANDIAATRNHTARIQEYVEALDAKVGGLKDYSEKLNEILAAIKGIDFTSPDYTADLAEIKQLLQDFSCNCNCDHAGTGSDEGSVDMDRV